MLDHVTYICIACKHEFLETVQPSRCPVCTAQGDNREFPTKATLTIAQQNDKFRRAILTGEFGNLTGTIWHTPGVTALGQKLMAACLVAIAEHDNFNAENDPWADHGMGFMTVEGQRIWWKIDLYDLDRNFGSPEPENPAVTHRVLTIFLPSEY